MAGYFPSGQRCTATGVAFVGPPQRFPRRQAPVGQVTVRRADRDPHAKALRDQITRSLACLEGKGRLELVGAAVGDPSHGGRGLMRGQAGSLRPAAFLRPQRGEIAQRDPLTSVPDAAARDPEGAGRDAGLHPAVPCRALARGQRSRGMALHVGRVLGRGGAAIDGAECGLARERGARRGQGGVHQLRKIALTPSDRYQLRPWRTGEVLP